MANIYVIDDDDQLLRMVGLILERAGHETTLINSPTQGLEKVQAAKPDLLVLDVMMPGVSGHDICRQLRADKATADLLILMLTARAQDVDRTAALNSGADDYLSKPVSAQELIQRISGLLARNQPAQPPAPQGVVIALFGLRGGIGRTSLAVNLAAALRRTSQEEVCLLELTPSGGQAMVHLRLQPKGSWAELSATPTWEEVQTVLTAHQSGIRLLAAPMMPLVVTSPTAELTTALLDVLRQHNSYVVVDLPAALTPASWSALEASDMVLHVVSPEMVAVQTAVQSNRALSGSDVALKQKSHISNQVTAEAQLSVAVIERGLATKLAFQIGYDANQTRALAQGVPLVLTSAQSPLPAAVRRMAEAIWQRAKAGG